MEELGIGRPSTYASILGILQDRKYISIEKNRIEPKKNGQLLSEFLRYYFTRYVDDDFTANMEDNLDKVALNSLNWRDMLSEFWKNFNDNIKKVKGLDTIETIKKVQSLSEYFLPINMKCTICKDGKLELRWGRFSLFIACCLLYTSDAADDP